MWSPDMPPCAWQRGEREGGTAWLPWKCGTCVSHAQASAYSSRPSSIPFSRCPPLSPFSPPLPLPCAAPVCRTPHSEMTPKTVGKLLRKCITACHFDTLWCFPHNAHFPLPFPHRGSARSLCLLLGNWTCDERARASAGHNHSEGCTNSLQGLNELWIERDKPGESSESVAILYNINYYQYICMYLNILNVH